MLLRVESSSNGTLPAEYPPAIFLRQAASSVGHVSGLEGLWPLSAYALWRPHLSRPVPLECLRHLDADSVFRGDGDPGVLWNPSLPTGVALLPQQEESSQVGRAGRQVCGGRASIRDRATANLQRAVRSGPAD